MDRFHIVPLIGSAVALLLLLLLLVDAARAHDAPAGWSYPFACCSGYDCREVPASTVLERPEGYVVPSGEVVPHQDARLKVSPDGAYHWCSLAGADDGRTLCLFVPPRSY